MKDKSIKNERITSEGGSNSTQPVLSETPVNLNEPNGCAHSDDQDAPDCFDDIDIRDFEDDEGYDPDAADDSFIPSYLFSNPDPYFKRDPIPENHLFHNFRVDEEGHIWAKNLSAWWLPDISFEAEVGRTVFSVSASYAGIETLDRKLKRIMTGEAKESMDKPTEDPDGSQEGGDIG